MSDLRFGRGRADTPTTVATSKRPLERFDPEWETNPEERTTALLSSGPHLLTVPPSDADDDLIVVLHDELAATAERPVDASANRWLGEAEAVAADLVDADVEPSVRRERVGHVRDLLAQVDDTGDPEADDHVARARRLAGEILDADGEG